MEATSRARELMAPYPPSSPSIAILKDGKLVYMMERRDIEMSGAEAIAAQLKPPLQSTALRAGSPGPWLRLQSERVKPDFRLIPESWPRVTTSAGLGTLELRR